MKYLLLLLVSFNVMADTIVIDSGSKQEQTIIVDKK
jgi:hypothetical protein